MLIKLEIIEQILLTIFETPHIERAVPISALLISPSGTAKSSLIRCHAGPAVHVTDGFTQSGLWDIVQNDPKNEITYICVPDINPTLSRQAKVVEAAIGNLLTLTFDGTIRMDDGRQNKLMKHDPVGFVGAVTPEMYMRYAKKWFALGLRRRIIPLYYEYSLATTEAIQESVRAGKINRAQEVKQIIHSKHSSKVNPAIIDRQSYDIKSLSEKFATMLGKTAVPKHLKDKRTYEWVIRNVAPIDPHMTLRTLAQANAVRHSRAKVGTDDVEFLIEFLSLCDPERPRSI